MTYEQGVVFCRRVLQEVGAGAMTALDALTILHNALAGTMDPPHGDVDQIGGAWRVWDARSASWTGEFANFATAQAAAAVLPAADTPEFVATRFDETAYLNLDVGGALALIGETASAHAAGEIGACQAVSLMYDATEDRLDWERYHTRIMEGQALADYHGALDARARRLAVELFGDAAG